MKSCCIAELEKVKKWCDSKITDFENSTVWNEEESDLVITILQMVNRYLSDQINKLKKEQG